MKSLWWGSLPWEQDGGAVVNYYLLKMLNYLDPKHEFFGLPKVPEQLEPNALPFMQFLIERGDMKQLFKNVPLRMKEKSIPLLVMFHLPHQFIPMANFVKDVSSKTIIHQTIHWANDDVFESKLLNDVDKWVIPTQWGLEQFLINAKVPREKTKYLPHAVDVEKFYPHNTTFREKLRLDSKQKVILVTGRCSLLKGIQQIIPVMRPIINDYNSVFVIRASSYSGLPKSEAMGYIFDTMARQFPRNVLFLHDWLPPEKQEEIMASSDILVQPSGHEGFDVPLIEAMACKKVIAVSNIPNHWEILGKRNRYCGVFMEPTVVADVVNNGQQEVKVPSPDVIDGTLRFLLENPEECQVMAENGYTRARRYYNLAKVASKWLELMESMIDVKNGN